MELALLEEIGLTKGEISVYMALLELGSSTVGPIVDKAKVSSSKVYDILERLMDKGLASYVIKENTKYFESAQPSRILDYMQERKKEIEEKENRVKEILPQLELRQRMAKNKQEVNVYEGLKGIKTVREKSLRELKAGDEFYILGISATSSEQLRNYWMNYHKRRSQSKIGTKMLINRDAPEKYFDERNKLPHTNVKRMPFSASTPSWFDIYDDRMVIGVTGEEPIAVEIKSSKVAESFKAYFEALWNQKVMMFEGQEAVESSYNEILKNSKKSDDVIIFAAKPETKRGVDFNRDWNREMRKRTRNVRLLYYGNNQKNIERAKEISEQGCETKILATAQSLPISSIVVGDKILQVVWSKNPFTLIIENKTVADSYRTNFELLWNQDTTVSKGWDAFKNALSSMLNEIKPGDRYNVLGATLGSEANRKEYTDFFADFHQERSSKGVHCRLLFYQDEKDYVMNKIEKKYWQDKGEIKFLSYNQESPVQIFTYNDKAMLSIQEKEPTVIIINNPKVAESFRKNFENAWNQDTQILKGVDAVQDLFEQMLEAGSCDFIAARGYFVEKRPEYIDKWEKRAEKAGFKMRNIVDPEVKGHRITKFKFAQTRYTLQKEFAELSAIWIFGEKVAISNWTDKEPIVVMMDNKAMYDMYSKQFELLWNKEKI
ncbi:helix-turn-helix domain-containing protein [Candidatus Woesearchaeota archaeon]|nr:helix-turn-helix domain-containing protein [Candidatus Woesearchaeota archaeon]